MPQQTGQDSPVAPDTGEGEKSSSGRRSDVTCLVCGRRYRTLRADHLQQHGLTRERYRRIYGAPAVDSASGPIQGSGDPHLDMIARLSQRVADSSGFIDALAQECSERILSSAPLRVQVAFAAAQIIQGRVAIHADAMGRLARVSDELGADWRVSAGGHQGRPTPTKDLIGMAMQAHAEIAKAEEMVLKAAKLALDERKVESEMAAAPGYTFSGAAESIAIPQDLGAADREALRALMGNLTKHVDLQRRARKAITVNAQVVDVESSAPSGSTVPPVQSATSVAADAMAQDNAMPDPIAMTTAPIPRPRRRRRA